VVNVLSLEVDLLGLAEVERARPSRRDWWRDRYSSDGSADRRRSVWLGKGRRWARAVYWLRLSISVCGSFSMDVEVEEEEEDGGRRGGCCCCCCCCCCCGRLARNCGKRKGLEGVAVAVGGPAVWVLEWVTSRTGAVDAATQVWAVVVQWTERDVVIGPDV
jgi:hypothetical protein